MTFCRVCSAIIWAGLSVETEKEKSFQEAEDPLGFIA